MDWYSKSDQGGLVEIHLPKDVLEYMLDRLRRDRHGNLTVPGFVVEASLRLVCRRLHELSRNTASSWNIQRIGSAVSSMCPLHSTVGIRIPCLFRGGYDLTMSDSRLTIYRRLVLARNADTNAVHLLIAVDDLGENSIHHLHTVGILSLVDALQTMSFQNADYGMNLPGFDTLNSGRKVKFPMEDWTSVRVAWKGESETSSSVRFDDWTDVQVQFCPRVQFLQQEEDWSGDRFDLEETPRTVQTRRHDSMAICLGRMLETGNLNLMYVDEEAVVLSHDEDAARVPAISAALGFFEDPVRGECPYDGERKFVHIERHKMPRRPRELGGPYRDPIKLRWAQAKHSMDTAVEEQRLEEEREKRREKRSEKEERKKKNANAIVVLNDSDDDEPKITEGPDAEVESEEESEELLPSRLPRKAAVAASSAACEQARDEAATFWTGSRPVEDQDEEDRLLDEEQGVSNAMYQDFDLEDFEYPFDPVDGRWMPNDRRSKRKREADHLAEETRDMERDFAELSEKERLRITYNKLKEEDLKLNNY